MNALLRSALCGLVVLSLSACLFKEPIFTEGFTKLDPAVAGVWTAEGDDNDPREREFAVVAPIGTEAYMLHYPAGEKDGFYFEARPLKVRDREVWQLRQVAAFREGAPTAEALTYTLIWPEAAGEGKVSIRSVRTEGPQTEGPAALKKALEDPKGDWNELFGEAKVFTRLKDK